MHPLDEMVEPRLGVVFLPVNGGTTTYRFEFQGAGLQPGSTVT